MVLLFGHGHWKTQGIFLCGKRGSKNVSTKVLKVDDLRKIIIEPSAIDVSLVMTHCFPRMVRLLVRCLKSKKSQIISEVQNTAGNVVKGRALVINEIHISGDRETGNQSCQRRALKFVLNHLQGRAGALGSPPDLSNPAAYPWVEVDL